MSKQYPKITRFEMRIKSAVENSNKDKVVECFISTALSNIKEAESRVVKRGLLAVVVFIFYFMFNETESIKIKTSFLFIDGLELHKYNLIFLFSLVSYDMTRLMLVSATCEKTLALILKYYDSSLYSSRMDELSLDIYCDRSKTRKHVSTPLLQSNKYILFFVVLTCAVIPLYMFYDTPVCWACDAQKHEH